MVDAILAHPPKDQPISRRAARERAIFMLNRVGIPDAAKSIRNFPHQFSGGMSQRIMIALALQSNPALLIADEPTSALDVTLEAQITGLIRELRDEMQTSILYITHDLGIVAQLCDQVVVLYAGNIVETGDIFRVFREPLHPYTRALLHSHPAHQARVDRLITIRGRVPSLKDLPLGCKFAPRCDLAQATCFTEEPACSRWILSPWRAMRTSPGWTGKAPSSAYTGFTASQDEQPAGSTLETASSARDAEPVVRVADVKMHYKDTIGWLGKNPRRKRRVGARR